MARELDPADVRLLPGPFLNAQELGASYLLRLEPDRLLAWFRKEAGLEPRAEPYPGWEQRGVAGHSLGHYLSACSLMHRATGDARFKERVDHVVRELAECQAARGTGYIGAIPDGEAVLEEVRAGDIRSQGFDLNGLWVPFYTIHKVLAGLRDAHRLCGNEEALRVERDFALWVEGLLAPLDDAQMQQVLAAEHGGMMEVLCDLAGDTGDGRFVALARRFHHDAVLSPLAQGRDIQPGLHANTQVPKLIGMARLHEMTSDEGARRAAEFFWRRVARHHSYANGGNSMAEHFGEPDRLTDRLSPHTAETCNVHNMLKLSGHLFSWAPRGEVGDFMERAHLGQILASQHPEHATMTYFMSLEQGGHKEYNTLFDMFTCCIGTGMENHARHHRGIAFEDGERLFLNLFIASEIHWRERGIVLRVETRYPDDEIVRVVVDGEPAAPFTLALREPAWSGGISLSVNGEPIEARPSSAPGFVEVARAWGDGDVVEARVPLRARAEPMPDNPRRVAFFHGPVLLAGDLGPIDDPAAMDPAFVPVIVTGAGDLASCIERIDAPGVRYGLAGTGRPRDVELVPFHLLHDRRQNVYWDVFDEPQWARREEEYRLERQRLADLEARTVDHVQPGEMQPERDHQQRGENTEAGAFAGRKFRHALDGWFSYELSCDPEAPLELVVTYYGGETGDRAFLILMDGEVIARESLHRDDPDRFLERAYPVPAELTRGRQSITLRFEALPSNIAGGIYGVRLARSRQAGTP